MKKTAENCRSAVERVAAFLGTGITRSGIEYRGFFTARHYLFYDGQDRVYDVCFNTRLLGCLVQVSSGAPRHLLASDLGIRRFLVRTRGLFIYSDFNLITEFLRHFLEKRGYPVEKLTWRENVNLPRWQAGLGVIVSGGMTGVFQMAFIRNRLSARLRDRDEPRPYFCLFRHQYLFYFRRRVLVRDGKPDFDHMLSSYAETDLKTTSPNPLSLLKQAIYGYKSSNLRILCSEEGLIPEIRHANNLIIFYYLANAIVVASVFVRVAERLKGNTWYTLAAGAMVFLRVPAEIVNLRRSMRITRNLPAARLRKLGDSEEFRSAYETKSMRSWRNFERAYTNLFRGAEYLPEKMEQYRLVKPGICQLVREGKNAAIREILSRDLNLGAGAVNALNPFALRLEPLNRKEIVRVFTLRAEKLRNAGLLRESEWPDLLDFIKKPFPELLERDTTASAYKALNDGLKRAERAPKRTELFTLVTKVRQAMMPFRRAELLLFIATYAIGYSATYFSEIPIIIFPVFYLFSGVISQLIISGLERFSNPVWMEYVFREMENDPTISSAADAWNELVSQHMRLLTLASSAGLIIGLSGRLLAPATNNISWFGVEAAAFIIFILGFREWLRFYYGLARRFK